MADDDSMANDSNQNERVSLADGAPLHSQPDEPGQTDQTFAVPDELAEAGSDTAEPTLTDSPESLDADLSQGTNREDTDPQHSVARPKNVDTIDKEENGVN